MMSQDLENVTSKEVRVPLPSPSPSQAQAQDLLVFPRVRLSAPEAPLHFALSWY